MQMHLDVFKEDPEFAAHEEEYAAIKREILGEVSAHDPSAPIAYVVSSLACGDAYLLPDNPVVAKRTAALGCIPTACIAWL